MQLEELCCYHKNARVDAEGDKGKHKNYGSRYVPGQFERFKEN